MTDLIAAPSHYTSHPSGVECIEIAQWFSFNLGTAIKCIWRCGEKGPALQDLQKARQYVLLERHRLSAASATVMSPCVDDNFYTRRRDLFSRRYEIAKGCRHGGQALLTIISASGMSGHSASTFLKAAEDHLSAEIARMEADQPRLPLEAPKPAGPVVKGCDTCLHVDNGSSEEPCATCLGLPQQNSLWEPRE